MHALLATDRLREASSLVEGACRAFSVHAIVPDAARSEVPACVRSVVARSEVEAELREHRPGWSPPWSDNPTTKHDTFFNLVRFYAVNLTHLQAYPSIVLLDDDVEVRGVLPVGGGVFDRALAADCAMWDGASMERPSWFEAGTARADDARGWLRAIVDSGLDANAVLAQRWWNFGVVVVNRSEWMRHHLSHRYEVTRRAYETSGTGTTASVAYGLVVAQIAFAGHVRCLPAGVVLSSLGFSDAARAAYGRSNASFAHFNGARKPWAEDGRRRLLDDEYAGCSNRAWRQCGGHRYRGERCCAVGWRCRRINDWYSQCIPDPGSATCRQNPFWAQCGGRRFKGATCCSPGAQCVRRHEWYHQCVPTEAA